MSQLVPPLSDTQASDAAKEMFQTIQTKFGMVPNIFRTIGHAPDVLKATLDLNTAISHDLDGKLRELAYLKTSQLNSCHYCFHYHKGLGRKAGVSDAQIENLEGYEQSSAYTDVEKTVLRFAEQWTRKGKVSPEVIKQLAQSLTPAAIITLAATVALANWTNRFNESFSVELP